MLVSTLDHPSAQPPLPSLAEDEPESLQDLTTSQTPAAALGHSSPVMPAPRCLPDTRVFLLLGTAVPQGAGWLFPLPPSDLCSDVVLGEGGEGGSSCDPGPADCHPALGGGGTYLTSFKVLPLRFQSLSLQIPEKF